MALPARDRGLTLVELLLAIGLLLAIAGLTLPALFQGLARRAFESTAETVRQQMLLARAHAQVSGRPVEVRYEPGPPRVTARYFPIGGDAGDEYEPAGAAREIEDERRAIVESWSELALADGLRFADEPPVADLAPAAMAAARLGADEPPPLRLAVYMPDGSALLVDEAWLLDEHGRRAALSVNPFTGLPSVREQAGGHADDFTSDEPPVREPDFDADADGVRGERRSPRGPDERSDAGAGAGPGDDGGQEPEGPEDDGDPDDGAAAGDDEADEDDEEGSR